MDLERLKGQVDKLQRGIESALRTARQSTLLRQGLQVRIRWKQWVPMGKTSMRGQKAGLVVQSA